MRLALSNNGYNTVGRALRGIFSLPAQVGLQRMQLENRGLVNEGALRRALSSEALNLQKYDVNQRVIDSFQNADLTDQGVRNGLIMAVNGKAYMPYQNIGETGQVFDRGTGAVSNNVNRLSRAFEGVQSSIVNKNNAAAAASMALKQMREANAARGLRGSGEKPRKWAWTEADMIGDGQDLNGKPTISAKRYAEANSWSIENWGRTLDPETAMDYYLKVLMPQSAAVDLPSSSVNDRRNETPDKLARFVSAAGAGAPNFTEVIPWVKPGHLAPAANSASGISLSKFFDGVSSLFTSSAPSTPSNAPVVYPDLEELGFIPPINGVARETSVPEVQEFDDIMTAADYLNEEQVMELVRQNKITIDQARAIGLKRGWQ